MKECRECGEEYPDDATGHKYPPYTYDEWVCENCWNTCPECGNDDWRINSSNSTRRSNKKICKDCGKSYITQPATG